MNQNEETPNTTQTLLDQVKNGYIRRLQKRIEDAEFQIDRLKDHIFLWNCEILWWRDDEPFRKENKR